MEPTEWRALPGNDKIIVSNDGRVAHLCTGWVNEAGYRIVQVTGDRRRPVHQLVAAAFIGEPTGPVVRHLNDQKLDNRPENLAYGTQRDNALDSKRNGTMRNGWDERIECPNGHAYTESNTAITGTGRRSCRKCYTIHNANRILLRQQVDAGLVQPERSCDEEGCERLHYARGLCRTHYRRMRYAAGSSS